MLAFGSPFGYFQFSVTRGIVSAVDRPNPYSDDPRKPGDFIQVDAAINPGNTGGPLVKRAANDRHQHVHHFQQRLVCRRGICDSFANCKGLGRADHQGRNVHHGYLGISMNDVTPDNASFFNLPDATGAIVSQVTPDSPASRAGLKQGDVLREINGKKIVNGGAIQVIVSETAPGNPVDLGILRNGKPETLKVTVGEFKARKRSWLTTPARARRRAARSALRWTM